ncbi:4-hydroxyphenylacetate 3-hydroxylase family protein [Labrys wisconsinensis]|uniref:4-hydroxyphenylacetate 3-monooxygenase n=1 Tax=Labrys wisconsinensis TaxID=425677 RepID=A0ABU0JBY1_9HYPH|nr:4-hydroxyphenylacetate 3-hydroxylase family protein [Labrys wisconsinensis]MDQ0471788.1 4-hydroxyphenylacetate 3-monooxygenase [Labrys wisconsinensis]
MRSEDFRADKARPFTGAEYLASLNDGRTVYINGERVADVVSHPAMRNSARSLARLYDALHDPARQPVLTSRTDTGSGGFTHKYFRVARSAAELVAQQGAIADWARMSYGWMGRTADYKAALMNTLGANAAWYGPFRENALAWHRRAQEAVLFMNHAIVNPPIDRDKPADQVKDVFVHITKETDAGIRVTGAKVVATSSALTHYNFLAQSSATVTEDPSLSVMFIVPMNAPGVKMICRVSYEETASRTAHPFDYPLSSRFDENDAILVLDDVFIPWEDVLVLRDAAKILSFHPASGFMHGYCFQGCTRFAVKLDFLAGLLAKALRATGGEAFRGNQAALGEVIALRHMFWSFSNAMAYNPVPWAEGAVLPNLEAALAYRTFMSEAYPRVIETVRRTVASGLIYLPSSARDFANPEIDRYLARYVRGSKDMGHIERIKIMKLLWDATGTEFGGRHALYELNYAGAPEEVRLQVLKGAERSGRLKAMEALVDTCMADYDEKGWTSETWLPPLSVPTA